MRHALVLLYFGLAGAVGIVFAGLVPFVPALILGALVIVAAVIVDLVKYRRSQAA